MLAYLVSESVISSQAWLHGCSPPGDNGFRTLLEFAAVRLFGTIFSGTVVAKDGSRLGLEGKAVKGVRDRSEVLDVDAKESEGVAVVKEEEWVRAGRLDGAEGANRDEGPCALGDFAAWRGTAGSEGRAAELDAFALARILLRSAGGCIASIFGGGMFATTVVALDAFFDDQLGSVDFTLYFASKLWPAAKDGASLGTD